MDDGRMGEMMMKDKACLSQGNPGYCCSKRLGDLRTQLQVRSSTA